MDLTFIAPENNHKILQVSQPESTGIVRSLLRVFFGIHVGQGSCRALCMASLILPA